MWNFPLRIFTGKACHFQKQATKRYKTYIFMKQFHSMKMLKRFIFKECIIRHVHKFLQTLEAQVISVFLCSHLLLLLASHFSLTFVSVSCSNIVSFSTHHQWLSFFFPSDLSTCISLVLYSLLFFALFNSQVIPLSLSPLHLNAIFACSVFFQLV